ncbi:MAG TPA: PEP-CTERM sorting domain-containing protein [Rhodanobacteraceae bacterium]|nr:PEP-CTERM sorting domain-containing protein [Rhodanobacteraceae bacterium]
MKRYLFLALSAIVLAMLVVPDALAVRIRIADPPPLITLQPPPPNNYICDGLTVVTSNQACNIFTLGEPAYQVTFLPCSTQGIPTQTPPPTFSWCLWMNNVTQTSVNKFTFEFTIPEGGSLDQTDVLTCDAVAPNVPGFSSTNTCHGTVSAEDRLKITYFTDPSLQNGSNFWLYTDFVNMPDPALVTVSVAVPEPGGLGLFGLGLLALGIGYGWQQRRRGARQGDTP